MDKKSKRVNVPSIFVEIYYIILCGLLYTFSIWNLNSPQLLFQILAIYFLIDTSVWLLYYFFLRRFYEETYAIMHVLEYIVLLPLVIICQTCCVSIISNIDFSSAISMLFLPTNACDAYILVISIVYSALIFGLIISNLPVEQIKVRHGYKYDIAIIGNGDVVKNRLLPAIIKNSDYKEQFTQVAIFDTVNPDVKAPVIHKFCSINLFNINNSVKDVLGARIIWIATPSYVHYKYLGQIIFSNKFIVIEKPLTIFQQELNAIKALRAKAWNSVFCLSYYYLEKALPLSYLYSPFDFYSKYLDMSLSREHILTSMKRAGALRSIELYLNEGEDSRQWLKDEIYGGQYFETFVHLVVMTKSIIGAKDEITVSKWEIGDSKSAVGSQIRCYASSNHGASIYLEMAKCVTPRREGVIKYENAEIKIDFNAQSIQYFDNSGNAIFQIKTNDLYGKYEIQLDMVRRCEEENITPSTIDGSEIQIDALQWLIDNQPINIEHFQY